MSAGTEVIALDCGSVTLSGLVAMPAGVPPRVLMVALHGGGMRASYFDGGVDPAASLLGIGSRVGYAVLALDRPGYGSSAQSLPTGMSLAEQATIVVGTIEAFQARFAVTAPVFLVGHSMGSKLALQIAAEIAPPDLIGIEFSGAGVRYNPELRSYPGRDPDDGATLTTEERRELFWGPAHLYPDGALAREQRPTAPVPPAEVQDAVTWRDRLPRIAPSVRVPVRYTIADHELWWDVSPATLDEFVAMFTSSPRVEVAHQPAAGHNISLGRTARAYHLRVAAFAEECLLSFVEPADD